MEPSGGVKLNYDSKVYLPKSVGWSLFLVCVDHLGGGERTNIYSKNKNMLNLLTASRNIKRNTVRSVNSPQI